MAKRRSTCTYDVMFKKMATTGPLREKHARASLISEHRTLRNARKAAKKALRRAGTSGVVIGQRCPGRRGRRLYDCYWDRNKGRICTRHSESPRSTGKKPPVRRRK